MHSRNMDVMHLAELIGRTPNSVALRLANFASCDPILQSRGIKGMTGGQKQCQPYWDKFISNREKLLFESESILANYENTTIEKKYHKELIEIPKSIVGEEKVREVETRVNQSVFRSVVLANYNVKCALTGIDMSELLVASHIIPWADKKETRLNPENGICLSSLYDKAFDQGLITFNDDYMTIFSHRLKKNVGKEYYSKYFKPIDGQQLIKPEKYYPNKEFLEYHRDVIFNH